MLGLQRAAGNAAVASAVGVSETILSGLFHLVQNFEGILGWDRMIRAQMWLVDTLWSVGTMGKLIDTALIRMETERLIQETAEIKAETDRIRDHNNGHPGPRPFEELIVLGSMVSGISGDIDLTDEVFFSRHPERRDRRLDPKDPADKDLISEWVGLRQGVVRRTLAGPLGQLAKSGVKGKGGGAKKAAE